MEHGDEPQPLPPGVDGDERQPLPPGVDEDERQPHPPGVDREERVPAAQQFVWPQPPQFAWPPQYAWPHQYAWPQPWAQPWAQPQAQPAQPAEPRPDRVKLGNFLQSRPATWFNLAEAACRRNNVAVSRDKYDIILSSLPDEVVKKLGALADGPDGHADPYEALKARVLQLYAPSIWEDLNTILTYAEIDMRPSAIMTDMLALLPSQEQPGLLFKAVWLGRLSPDVRAHVQLQAEDLSCVQLGELADKAWLARITKPSSVVAAIPADNGPEEVADMVAALQLRKPGGGGQRQQQQGDQRSGKKWKKKWSGKRQPQPQPQPPKGICQLHHQYGVNARYCKEPTTCLLANQVSGNVDGQDW